MAIDFRILTDSFQAIHAEDATIVAADADGKFIDFRAGVFVEIDGGSHGLVGHILLLFLDGGLSVFNAGQSKTTVPIV